MIPDRAAAPRSGTAGPGGTRWHAGLPACAAACACGRVGRRRSRSAY